MKICPENKFEVTFFNSFLCSIKKFRFINYLLLSLIFVLLLFLIISNIYTILFSHSIDWKQYKHINELYGFNMTTFATIFVVLLDIILGGLWVFALNEISTKLYFDISDIIIPALLLIVFIIFIYIPYYFIIGLPSNPSEVLLMVLLISFWMIVYFLITFRVEKILIS